MSRYILLLFFFALPACAQKNVIELKTGASLLAWASGTMPTEPWSSEGNGGGEVVGFLSQLVNQPQACIYGPLHATDGIDIRPGGSICARGGHGSVHVADFGTGPFLIDDEGYIFWLPMRPMYPQAAVRDFANGVH